MSYDNLLSAEVVTEGGSMLHASPDENPDLFRALRGGGGNVGVVTSFRYRLHELKPEVYLENLFRGNQKIPRDAA